MPNLMTALLALIGGLPSSVRNVLYTASHYAGLVLTVVVAAFANSSVVGITIPDRWTLIATVALTVIGGIGAHYLTPDEPLESSQPPVNDDISAPDPVLTAAPAPESAPAPMTETPAAPNAPGTDTSAN